MAGVDNRVVGMTFDNAQFESRLGTTLQGLDKLNKSLNFTNAQNNLAGLAKAGSSFSMGDMGSKIDGISAKFAGLATVGITALSNITNRAVNSGLQLAKSFTVAPITAGFQNFQQKMTSISTILANTADKGTKLKDVQGALGDLNTYANLTIYDFAQMTQNLGTFTAAGVDLNTSKEAIKGIANLAAISGSNTDQASMAMYQLSQAMAAGTVKVQDWNSVVNAGMGGEVFQKALFTTATAMKTLPGVPVGETFEQWTAKGNTLRKSLDSGAVSTKVLTTTLKAMTGDFSIAQLQAMGYTQTQAMAMAQLGKTGLQAATQIKSVKALTDMLKENAASGWATTFSIIGGTYDQTVGLLTGIGNSLSAAEQRSMDARNALLQGWSDLGGRTALIQGFKNAITALGDVLHMVEGAFRTVFPPETPKQLLALTVRFEDFTKKLIPSKTTLGELRNFFVGIFDALKIGETVIKGVVSVFTNLFSLIRGTGVGGGILSLANQFGLFLQRVEQLLVEQNRIVDFFNTFNRRVEVAINAIKMAVNWVVHFVDTVTSVRSTITTMDGLGKSVAVAGVQLTLLQRITAELRRGFDDLKNSLSGIHLSFQGVTNVASAIIGALDVAGAKIRAFFSGLGQAIANAIHPGDFNAAVDAVNVGFMGGIFLLVTKFVGMFTKMNIMGGLSTQITGLLSGVRGQLSAMQTQLKAKALEEIAVAIGILAAAIVALSLISPDKMTNAMVALGEGVTILVIAMTKMQSLGGGTMDAAKFTTLAAGMTLMSSAVLVLTGSIAVLSRLDWNQLSRGLIGVTAILALMVATARMMQGGAIGMVAAGAAMIPLATGLAILAGVVALFGHMSWDTIGRGLVGLAGSLIVIVAAMRLMDPVAVVATGLAMIPLAIGITILSGAVKVFGTMSWAEIARGLVGLAGSLVVIALAMSLMPMSLPLTAAGLILIGIALSEIAGVMRLLGGMSWGEIGKGLAGIAAMLVLVALGANAMTEALPGAAAMIVVAGSLVIFTGVVKALGTIKISELIQGLLGMAAVFAVLGISALVMQPVIPALLGLGAAMLLIGGGFALFGEGANLFGTGMEKMSRGSVAGIKAIIESIKLFIQAIPQLIAVLVVSLEQAAGNIANGTSTMLGLFTVLLGQILDTVIKMAPKIAQALVALITDGLKLIRNVFPDVAQTAVDLIFVLLRTIGDNAGRITKAAVDVIVNFANTLAGQAYRLINAAVNLITSFIAAIGRRAGDIAFAGLGILVSLLGGIANNIGRVVTAVGNIIATFIFYIGAAAGRIITVGGDVIAHLITGVTNNVQKVVDAGTNAIIKFVFGITNNALKIVNAAGTAILQFLWGLDVSVKKYEPQIIDAGFQLGKDIIAGAVQGVEKHAGGFFSSLVGAVTNPIGTVNTIIGRHSPSKLFAEIGKDMMLGASIGVEKESSFEDSIVTKAEAIVKAFQETLSKMPDALQGMEEVNITITPVLDLSKVRAGARGLGALLSASPLVPNVSTAQAGAISTTAELVRSPAEPTPPTSNPLTFNQTINSPTALSANDIYRNTNSQIARAKEELSIP